MQARHPHIHQRIHGNAMAAQGKSCFCHDAAITAATTEHRHGRRSGWRGRQFPKGQTAGMSMSLHSRKSCQHRIGLLR